MNLNEFAKFLELPEDERFKIVKRRIHWWQRISFWIANKWWTSVRKENPDLPAIVLWESFYKGRF
jgi:hypothetical protein